MEAVIRLEAAAPGTVSASLPVTGRDSTIFPTTPCDTMAGGASGKNEVLLKLPQRDN